MRNPNRKEMEECSASSTSSGGSDGRTRRWWGWARSKGLTDLPTLVTFAVLVGLFIAFHRALTAPGILEWWN